MGYDISYGEVKESCINYMNKIRETDNLKELCHSYFNIENFLEDGEKIELPVVHFSYIEEIQCKLSAKIFNSIEELAEAKGAEKKEEIRKKLKDYFLLESVIVDMLLKVENRENSILVLT